MAVGVSSATAAKALDCLCGNATWTTAGDPWIKLHVGDPGAAGTSNAATETTRKQCSFAVASGNSIASDAVISWVGISGSQTATHFSAWDASVAGNFLFSGTISNGTYTAGSTFTIASGAMTASFATIAA